MIIVPNLAPDQQRQVFGALLASPALGGDIVNEAIEIRIEGDEIVFDRYALP